MKVNMTPNPLDVVTIHASQGDTEARQWEFELHNNGELIDTSEITEQLFFKAYKGGTEQILPENTSTPTTSPFKGDIKYPQGLLSDQEFLYRESPTEEDGLAKITDIKGNTLVWNQQIPIPTRQSGTSSGITVTNNGDGSLTLNGTPSNMNINWWIWGNYATDISILSLKASHKYFVKDCNLYRETGQVLLVQNIGASPVIWSPSADYELCSVRVANGDTSKTYTNVKVYPMIIDLTQMGLDSITSVDEFTSLFSLPYYAYNQGTLLSFNGNGIKTTGKNLNPWQGVNYNAVVDRTIFLKKGDYVLSTDNGNAILYNNLIYLCLTDGNGNNVTEGGITSQYLYLNTTKTFYFGGEDRNNIPFTLNFDAFVSFGFNNQKPTNFSAVQLEFGTTPSSYEPYTSSTLSLPISTYFPTGMKSAGNVYDELTPTKGITRIGAVDLGSLTWTYDSSIPRFYTLDIQNIASKPESASIKGNVVCPAYITETIARLYLTSFDHVIALSNTGSLNIKDTNYNSAGTLKSSLQGIYLYYELATSTETSFTTASLVTENGETPLSNEDGVLIGKCTEQLSSESGFFDAKIKLADEDGECYSNKIQLHVERSPQ